MKLFTRVLTVPKQYLFPVIFVLTIVGAYTTNSSIFDIWVMILFGVVGFFLVRNGFPIAPMILGFILRPLLETYMRRALMTSGNAADFFTNPISALFILAGIACVVFTLRSEIKEKRGKSSDNTLNV